MLERIMCLYYLIVSSVQHHLPESSSVLLPMSVLVSHSMVMLPRLPSSASLQYSCGALQAAGVLSILFDVGGVAGGAIAGILSDGTGAPACVSTAFVFGSVPCMWLYRR